MGKAKIPGGRGSGAGFPRRARLLRHSDFERAYQQGRRYFAAHMTVFYLRREEGEGTRVGFTAGRVLGGAVERNRIKRRLREAVRLGSGTMNLPADVVINAKKSLLTIEFEELRREVEQAFAVIGQKAAPRNRK
jgi:ribonuclease P protein component